MEEEFQEAEILWPVAGVSGADRGNSQGEDGGGEAAAPVAPCSVRPRQAAAPVDISRQKRRCRPWPASSEHYHATTLDQLETDGGDGGEGEGRRRRTGDDAKGTASDGSAVMPPHVLVARRRRLVRGRTVAYSMCAGKGRTLKGRDLRDVRNLVLKMTGFIEE